jgi:hypothetical protein
MLWYKFKILWVSQSTPYSKYVSVQTGQPYMRREIKGDIYNYISAPLTAKFVRSIYRAMNGHSLESSYIYELFTRASA